MYLVTQSSFFKSIESPAATRLRYFKRIICSLGLTKLSEATKAEMNDWHYIAGMNDLWHVLAMND
jgi:hypothetical protein